MFDFFQFLVNFLLLDDFFDIEERLNQLLSNRLFLDSLLETKSELGTCTLQSMF
jgi:hypothetical protein